MGLTREELEILRGKTSNPETIKLIAEMDREDGWKAKLETAGAEDLRVWPLVASIAENKEARHCIAQRTIYGADLMGEKQKEYKIGRKTAKESIVEINGIAMTHEGWREALPHAQKALDRLGVAFAANKSGLSCKLGRFHMESVRTNAEGKLYRMFDMGHGFSGIAGVCRPYFKDAEWPQVNRMKEEKALVQTEGWALCGSCGAPMRPAKNQ